MFFCMYDCMYHCVRFSEGFQPASTFIIARDMHHRHRLPYPESGGTVQAAVRKMGLVSQLASGGAGALFAAATGAAGKKTAMSDAECAAVLARAPLLRSLHAAEILAIVAHGVRRVHCPRGEVHVRQGNPGGSMYVVLAGRFDVLVKVSVFFYFFSLFLFLRGGGEGVEARTHPDLVYRVLPSPPPSPHEKSVVVGADVAFRFLGDPMSSRACEPYS